MVRLYESLDLGIAVFAPGPGCCCVLHYDVDTPSYASRKSLCLFTYGMCMYIPVGYWLLAEIISITCDGCNSSFCSAGIGPTASSLRLCAAQ